jgi:non-hemolytic enterotoxin B/C
MRSARLMSFTAANSDDTATKLDTETKPFGGQALILQAHASKMLATSTLDLSQYQKLSSIGSDLNVSITKAQANAKRYLDVILPKQILVIDNIKNYFDLQNALAGALDPNTDRPTAIQLLNAVRDQATQFKSDAGYIVIDLQTLRTGLSGDAANFNNIVQRLNAAVSGDNGVLADINNQLDSIDGKIAGAITGIVVSGLAVAGGVFLIAVGAIAGFVTAGTSTPLVVLGIGVVAAGVGGAVGASIALAGLLNAKSDMLQNRSRLTSEVNYATGLSSTFQDFATSATGAATAAQQMANAWTSLDNDLGTLITNVEKGNTDVPSLRRLFLTAANGTVKTIQTDVTTIKAQLAGVTVVQQTDPAKEKLADTVVRLAKAA